jgi:hypothetical protein
VDGQHLLPVREAELLERMDDLDAGVADQDVDAAEGSHRRLHRGVHLVFVGHVGADADRLAAGRLQFGGGGFGRFLVEVGDHDLRAFAGVDDRDLLADAAGRASDEGNLVFQLHESLP